MMKYSPEELAALAAAINANANNTLPKAPTEPVLLGNIQVKKSTKGETWMSATTVVEEQFVEVTLPQEVVDALAASKDVKVGEPKQVSDALQARKITGVRIKAQISGIRSKDGNLKATLVSYEGLEPYKDAVVPAKFAF